MRFLATAIFFMFCLPWAGSAAAQSTPTIINYGPCTITAIKPVIDAHYAAAVGIMSTDRGMREGLLGPGRRNAALCTFQVSDSFCKKEFLEFASNALATSMARGGRGAAFFDALTVADAADDPAGNALGLVLGVGGAVVGGKLGSDSFGFGGMIAGGLGGTLLGLEIGKLLTSADGLDSCRKLQGQFTSLTRELVSSGLRPQTQYRVLFHEIERLTERRSEEERLFAEAMIEAMAVAVAKIQSVRCSTSGECGIER